jgi:hypothetical protein
MAILVHFQKAREDARQVTYHFGYPGRDRVLVIEKASLAGSPVDEMVDHTYEAVVAKIPRMRRERETWPPGGTNTA